MRYSWRVDPLDGNLPIVPPGAVAHDNTFVTDVCGLGLHAFRCLKPNELALGHNIIRCPHETDADATCGGGPADDLIAVVDAIGATLVAPESAEVDDRVMLRNLLSIL